MVSKSEWKAFMCHNLGADETADPFTPDKRINGAYYQWGKKAAVANAPHAKYPNTNYAADAIIGTWSISYAADGSWLDASKNTTNDPCPTGWRVPTKTQWDGVVNNNTITVIGSSWSSSSTNYDTGKKFGNGLFMPAAGFRHYDNGTYDSLGTAGDYWSSTPSSTDYAYNMHIGRNSQGPTEPHRTGGRSVRCVSE
jgi:uncharacterized protein (TIGR02145 family)